MGLEIEFKSVKKSYPEPEGGRRKILDGATFTVPTGAFLKLEGPSGAGKSTVLNLIAGLLLPDGGEIIIDGRRIHDLSESKRDAFRAGNIGYVFQTFNLLSPLTVLENLFVPAILSGSSTGGDRARALEVLDEFGIGDQARKRPFHLSVGQRQRVAVARAILHRPKLLLADEPTANLDEPSALAVREAMFKLKEDGATLVVATHDPAFDLGKPDMVYNVERGEVL